MTHNAYDAILESVVSAADTDDRSNVAALEDAAMDYLDSELPHDERERIAASLGIVVNADNEPRDTWQRRIDDMENCSPTEYAEAIAADVLISDGLAAV